MTDLSIYFMMTTEQGGFMKALIFDMDGTLIDSMGAWHGLESKYLADLGINVEEFDFEQIATMSVDEVLAYIRKEYGVEGSLEQVRTFALDYMHRFYSEEAKLKPGVIPVLEYFKELGIPMIVGTATEIEPALVALEHTGIRSYFQDVYSSSTEGFAKNDKHFFYGCAKMLGVKPQEAALFDDAIYAVVTAKEAGLYTVAVLDQSYDQDIDALSRRADEVISGFENWPKEQWAKEKLTWGR